ncbi:MAG TPA: hypothetical protein VEY07_04430 [Thermoplasmata archaeon]|nr:hypothetical protein [Thermoplasmata archaeon]
MAPHTALETEAFVSGLVGALANKHGQMDIRLDKVSLGIPGSPLGVELNGTVSVVVHMRDLTDEERKAHITRNVAAIRGK